MITPEYTATRVDGAGERLETGRPAEAAASKILAAAASVLPRRSTSASPLPGTAGVALEGSSVHPDNEDDAQAYGQSFTAREILLE